MILLKLIKALEYENANPDPEAAHIAVAKIPKGGAGGGETILDGDTDVEKQA